MRQQRLYQQWANLCVTLSVNPALQDPSIPHIEILRVYSHLVRHAKNYKHRMERLGKDFFSQAWGVVAATHLLDGLPGPIKPLGSQAHTGINKCLAGQLKTYGIKNPPFSWGNLSPCALFTPLWP